MRPQALVRRRACEQEETDKVGDLLRASVLLALTRGASVSPGVDFLRCPPGEPVACCALGSLAAFDVAPNRGTVRFLDRVRGIVGQRLRLPPRVYSRIALGYDSVLGGLYELRLAAYLRADRRIGDPWVALGRRIGEEFAGYTSDHAREDGYRVVELRDRVRRAQRRLRGWQARHRRDAYLPEGAWRDAR